MTDRPNDPASKPRDRELFAVVEPRIRHLAREIRRLLALVEFEKDGRPVEIDGFRLRDLSRWRDNHAPGALDSIFPFSGRCNSRCAFCSEFGVPFAREESFMTEQEARTRLRHYSPETGVCLFGSTRPHMETFLHPRAIELLKMARHRDSAQLFCLTTNGSLLDEEMVERLTRLGPLMLKLSLNTVDEAQHRRLMGLGGRTSTALRAPQLLRRHGIPYIGSIVAWPTLSLDTLAETIRHLEHHEAYAIRVRLPIIHRWVREQPDCDLERHWESVAEFARSLSCRVPLLVEPGVYSTPAILPLVDGVILNSPADRAGLRAGDVVEAIDGRSVITRNESHAILEQCHQSSSTVELEVDRGGRKLRFQLTPQTEANYPYDPNLRFRGQAYGVFHIVDFRLGYLLEVFDRIERYGAKKALLFSSPLVAPVFDMLTEKIPEFADVREAMTLYVETLTETVLGGNSHLLDGRFVEDFARAIRERLETDPDVDLILIPNAFGSAWGTDLSGESYSRLEMEFGIPVELIDWHFVYGRED
jgi:pyruvate-formate lyase-activating enzyme